MIIIVIIIIFIHYCEY